MQPQPGGRAPVFSVLQNAEFRAIWGVSAMGQLANWMEMLVLGWLVLQATDSPFQLGLLLVFHNLPRPIVSLFTGFIADRFSRHRILLVVSTSNSLISAGLLTLIVADLVQPWHAFLAISLLGTAKALEDPSRRTAILDIVGEGRVVNAMALESVSETAGKMVGPILGGILIATVGFSGAYIFLLALHTANAGTVLTKVRIPDFQSTRQLEPMWRSMAVAVRYAFHSPTLLAALFVTIVMNATFFPVRQFIPAIGRDELHVGAVLVGLLVASEGIGLFMGVAVMALSRNLRYLGRIFVLGSVGALITSIMFAWSPWYGLAFFLLVLGGVGQAGFNTLQSPITMLSSPQEMRGRMIGLQSVSIGVGTPLGTLFMGAIANSSIQWAVSISAVLGLLFMLPALIFTPLVRQPTVPVQPLGSASDDATGPSVT